VTLDRIRIGFLPLVDAALPILAREQGFGEEQGLEIELVRDMSWATVRDRLLYGHTDAAHMIAPLAIATALGRGRPAEAMTVPFVLGLNGNAVTFSVPLAAETLTRDGLGDPLVVGARLRSVAEVRAKAGKMLRFGVVHRYSSHNYMLRYWLAAVGIRPGVDVEIVTISPPFAADALAAGVVDGLCVGEPWNSVAVDRGVGRIALVTAQIWRRGVEKVLAMRSETAERSPEIVQRLIRALTDRVRLAQGQSPAHIPDFMFQYREAANFPWRSQAAWLYSQMLRWDGTPFSAEEAARAEAVFRPDLYRAALAGSGAVLPGASSKLEGAIGESLGAGSVQGRLMLGADRFFDGRAFDPDDIPGYLDGLP
jgi:ABC-type nitrate/sulfonate/bicarbonate transport system substrate-binding protein